MNRSVERIPLRSEEERGAYGVRTSLQIGTFSLVVYAPVFAVSGSSR
jgi:hypothetical protein